MKEVKFVKWLNEPEAEGKTMNPLGGLGGFFRKGMRWGALDDMLAEEARPYASALREAIIAERLKRGGDWHQNNGMPLFDDGTVSQFSFRAWGDFLAAVWSTEEDRDYGYMDFYMDAVLPDGSPHKWNPLKETK